MIHFSSRSVFIAVGVSLALGAGSSYGQQQETTTPVAQAAPVVATTDAAPVSQPAKAVSVPVKELIVLAPTPVVDEAGRPLSDPEGKPMWNEPVKQQRDKSGKPLFDKAGKPVMQTADNLGYDEKGKPIHAPKTKQIKPVSLSITSGFLQVDGFIARRAINYNTSEMKFLYIYTPGIGTTVVSSTPFPGATEQHGAIKGKSLKVKVDGHEVVVSSESPLLGKEKATASVYVMVNRYFSLPTKVPVMGYGSARTAPYEWPNVKPQTTATAVQVSSKEQPHLERVSEDED